MVRTSTSGVWLLLLLSSMTAALAEFVPPEPESRDEALIDAPAWRRDRLIPIETPRGSSLSFGVDPATVTLDKDGIVRYVVVASSAEGASTALFEGIRCARAEFRVYARQNTDEPGWSRSSDPAWQSLYETRALSAHPLAIARAGVCTGQAPNGPVETIVRSLRSASPRP